MVTKLYEGGNVFKDQQGQPLTVRIARDNVVPTVQWLEGITGLNLVDNMLGSTGKNETSGDLDLGVDSTKVSKDVLIQQLMKQGIDRNDIRKTGDAVHLKTPILGDASNGYVQTDFMFTDNPQLQQFSLAGGSPGSQYKGVHRNILLASLAKAQGFKWSPKFGLVNRETNEVISQDPKEIANTLVKGQPTDLASVEAIINKIKSRPDYEALVADARETLGRNNVKLPESIQVSEGSANWFRKFML
jgi:hypothetical protein